MRIVFVHTVNPIFSETQNFGIHFMPVWAYTLASHLKQNGFTDINLFDERINKRQNLIESDVYLFTGINQDYDAIVDLLAFVRQRFPKALCCIGGPISWSFHKAGKSEKLQAFDHIFIGDGEETLPNFLRNIANQKPNEKTIQTDKRFDLSKSVPMDTQMIEQNVEHYYGGVIEVSRGCPFLCEFCDIRILPDNNRSHVKPVQTIIKEIDHMARVGVKQVLFACDNLYGNPVWAKELAEALIEWTETTGFKMSLYTWLTINVSKDTALLTKLRKAGFDMFFIGVESFNKSSLLETAKVQNVSLELAQALRNIQSYGFIVVAGLIFGFDTDSDDIVDKTLEGMVESGLISGDPSLLMALPGTPLHHRMKLSGRLRDMKFNLGGFKYQTNIRYLRPPQKIREDFLRFVDIFTSGGYQFKRLKSYYECLDEKNFLPAKTAGYADLPKMLRMTIKNRTSVFLLVKRMLLLVASFDRSFFLVSGFFHTLRMSSQKRNLWFYFKFWLFNWSNALVKYGSLSEKDFDIDWVGKDFQMKNIVPEGYSESNEPIPMGKTNHQRSITANALNSHFKKTNE